MLEKKDFKKIEEVVKRGLRTEAKRTDKKIDTLAAAVKVGFDDVDKRFDKLDKEVTKIRATMVTKSYLDDKLADLEGSVIIRQRKQDKKVELLIEFLKKKNILDNEEINMLKEFQIFPSLENLKKSYGK